jgi:hypothetical protein
MDCRWRCPKDLAESGRPHERNRILYYVGYNFTIYIMWSSFLVWAEELADQPGVFRLYLSAANWFTR